MRIGVVAVAQIFLAASLTIWVLIFGPAGADVPAVCTVVALCALNALAILRTLRGPGPRLSVSGLWTAATGGLLLLALGSSPLWIDLVFPPAENLADLMVPIVHSGLTLLALALAALTALVAGWGMVSFRRWKRRPRPA